MAMMVVWTVATIAEEEEEEVAPAAAERAKVEGRRGGLRMRGSCGRVGDTRRGCGTFSLRGSA